MYRIILLCSLALFILQVKAQTEFKQKPQNKLIWLPLVFYTPETKLSGGVLLIHNLWKETEGKTSSLNLSTFYSQNQQSNLSLSPKLYFAKGQYEIFGTMVTSYFPNKFYGRGNDTKKENEEKYTQNTFLIGLGGRYRMVSNFYLKLDGSEQKLKITSFIKPGLIANEVNSGFGEYNHKSLGMSLDWDSRDYPQSPLQGDFITLDFSRHWIENTDSFMANKHFEKVELNLRHYHSLQKNRVLALQLLASQLWGHDIPFQSLFSLGGNKSLRGIYGRRFIDNSLGLIQIEYREDLSTKWSYSFFAGTGQVNPSLKDIEYNNLNSVVGCSGQYFVDYENRTKLRLDIGRSSTETNLYILFGEAF